MSNIAIKGATTGTGTFTIESPATNTDRTLTLPDEAGTILTTSSDVLTSASDIQGTLLKTTRQDFTTIKVTTATSFQTDAYSFSYTPLASGNTLIVVLRGMAGTRFTGGTYAGAIYRIYCDGNYSDGVGMWQRFDSQNMESMIQLTQSMKYTTTGTSAITIRAEYKMASPTSGSVDARFNDWNTNTESRTHFDVYEYQGSVS